MKKIIGLAALLLTSFGAAYAHHAFAAEFDANQPVTIQGTLTKLEWINPHGWIYLDVKGPNGSIEKWEVETGGPTALMKRGMRKTDLPVGIELIVKGFKAKKKAFTANGISFKKTDGTEYFLGSSFNGGGEGKQGGE